VSGVEVPDRGDIDASEEADAQAAPYGPKLEILTSRQFTNWLAEQSVSLAFTTYQAGKLFFIGLQPSGQLQFLSVHSIAVWAWFLMTRPSAFFCYRNPISPVSGRPGDSPLEEILRLWAGRFDLNHGQ
jgi:hypothetical protein